LQGIKAAFADVINHRDTCDRGAIDITGMINNPASLLNVSCWEDAPQRWADCCELQTASATAGLSGSSAFSSSTEEQQQLKLKVYFRLRT